MKKAILFFLVLAVSGNLAIGQAKKKSSTSTNEELVIKSLIEHETKAFFEIDQKSWADCWAHVPYAFWSFADTTDVNSFTGWEAISNGFANYFKTSKPSTAKIDRKWGHIRIYGTGAYARFTQHVNDDTNRPAQEEVRVLEKINGQWKIVCVSVIAIQKENRPIR
jgi:hypothetical protein